MQKPSAGYRRYASVLQRDDTSPGVLDDMSPGDGGYSSPGSARDVSPSAVADVSLAAAGDVFQPGANDVSSKAFSDTSPTPRGDTSLPAVRDACAWCKGAIVVGARADAIFCSRKCRQAAFRIRRRRIIDQANKKPKKFAFADPPYPGMSWMYKDQPSYAGEVDHAELVASLEYSYDGFALSTSARALATVLPLFTREYRICAWVKPIGVSGATFGLHSAWEPLIVVPGRQLRPGKRDWLAAQPARRGGNLIGRKPEAFCVWMFELLGMLPGDSLDDLFPGSGIVGRAWAEICR